MDLTIVSPSQTGTLGHLALGMVAVALVAAFMSPSQTGTLGHLACHPSNIALGATLCKHLREAPQKGLFGEGKGRAYPSDFGFQPLVERCERRSSTSPSLVPLAAELRWCRGPISFSGGSPMVSLAPCIQYIDA